ncbi:MAG: NAD(P)-dependent oxidoreductase [bacterium]|nr:NAD(P)-dependent oxidoreductase [bacterium]
MDRKRQPVVLITGAAGFLGSALTVDLAGDHSIVALDRRQPGRALLDAAPQVEWHRIDIAEKAEVSAIFESTRRRSGRIDFVVHLAAFYHFDLDRHPEYERTNVRGTSNVLQASIESSVSRLLFSSSMMAMLPPAPGTMLDERTPASGLIPYGRSKATNEGMIAEVRDRLPSIVLRIGGVFSDWCELPPLCSLIRQWGARTPLNRIVVGRGESGFPYVHRSDWVRLVRACLCYDGRLPPHETLLASQHGVVTHDELFGALQRARSGAGRAAAPLHVPVTLARVGLHMRAALGRITGSMPYERPWMLRYVDRPWVADTTRTRKRLDWDCSHGMRVCERLPVLLEHFENDRTRWERRNRQRANRAYSYLAD